MSGDDDDGQFGIEPLQAPQNHVAAEAGHVHVQQHRRWRIPRRLLQSRAAAIAFRNAKARLRKDVPHGPPHIAVVVYDQNSRLSLRLS